MKKASLVFLLILLCSTLSYAEEIKLTTIIPNQTNSRTNQGVIGSDLTNPSNSAYISDASIPKNGLVVEGNVIGAGWQNYLKITESGHWIAPAGVYKIMAWIVGGGGGGGQIGSDRYFSGGGGGGGCTNIVRIDVTPGSSWSITIGSGGFGGNTSVAGGNGGTTYLWNSAGTLIASVGGGGGGGSGNGQGGIGGTSTELGALIFNGNPGESSTGTDNITTSALVGTSGGSAGGVGASGAGTRGSAAPANSGGGGGGGSGGGLKNGGAGGDGYVIIWF